MHVFDLYVYEKTGVIIVILDYYYVACIRVYDSFESLRAHIERFMMSYGPSSGSTAAQLPIHNNNIIIITRARDCYL